MRPATIGLFYGLNFQVTVLAAAVTCVPCS